MVSRKQRQISEITDNYNLNGEKINLAAIIYSRYGYFSMPYSFAISPLQVIRDKSQEEESQYTCQEAQKGCTPSFVFSINGQVGFRSALEHMMTCRKKQCLSLRKNVREAMYKKISWLFTERALLGCIQIQPFLYHEKRAANVKDKNVFSIVANHLSHCPQESCAKLRRSLLLSVRDRVSPAQQNQLK